MGVAMLLLSMMVKSEYEADDIVFLEQSHRLHSQ